MHTTKRSQFTISCKIQPPPSQSKVNLGVLEENKWVDPLKWAVWSPIGHSSPPPQVSNIPPNFCCHKHSRLSVTRPIHRPTRHPTVYCGIVEFFDWDRWTILAHPLGFGQGIKSPRRPNFALIIYPIKQCRRSIARRNPTTPKHQDVEHDVAVGWTWWVCFIAPRCFVGEHG